jgi:hypothetical protein
MRNDKKNTSTIWSANLLESLCTKPHVRIPPMPRIVIISANNDTKVVPNKIPLFTLNAPGSLPHDLVCSVRGVSDPKQQCMSDMTTARAFGA